MPRTIRMNGDVGVKAFLALVALVASATGSGAGGIAAWQYGEKHYANKSEIEALRVMDTEIIRTLRELRAGDVSAGTVSGKLDQVIGQLATIEARLAALERLAMRQVP
jgi:hypothetical protein